MSGLRKSVLAVVGVLLALLVWAAINALRIWTYDETTDRGADAAIVLGASTWNGEPSPAFIGRIRHAVDLYRAGRARKLIFTGGCGAGEPVSNAEAGRRYALGQGVKPADILIEPFSRYTQENIAYASQIAGRHGVKTFLIVSDPLHMRRAMYIAKQRGLTAYPSPTPFSTYRSRSSKLWFLRRETWFLMQYQLLTRFVPIPPIPIR